MTTGLVMLGQMRGPIQAPPPPGGQTLLLSKEESELVARAVEDVISFANENPIEFHAYCPPADWQRVLDRVGQMTQAIERHAGTGPVAVPRDGILALFDLEECLIGARDEKLSAVKTSLVVSAGAAIVGTIFGIGWLSIPAYIASLALIFGKPLLMSVRGDRPEPFKIGCSMAVDSPRLGDHTAKGKIVERVVVGPRPAPGRYWWGVVRPGPPGRPASVCIGKGTFRVRIELPGPAADIDLEKGWEEIPAGECAGMREIVVWEPCGTEPRGGRPRSSGFAESFWVEYWGPMTGGTCRAAGPFG